MHHLTVSHAHTALFRQASPHSQLCIHQRACTSADERACCDGTVLWYSAEGCVIIRGIWLLSFAAATLPSGGRGASTGVHQPTASLFQVHFPGRKRVIGLNHTVLSSPYIRIVS